MKTTYELLDVPSKTSVESIMVSDFSMLKVIQIAQPVEDLRGRTKSSESHHVATGEV